MTSLFRIDNNKLLLVYKHSISMFMNNHMHKCTSIWIMHQYHHAYFMHMHSSFIICIMNHFHCALYCTFVLTSCAPCSCSWVLLDLCIPVHYYSGHMCTNVNRGNFLASSSYTRSLPLTIVSSIALIFPSILMHRL
jgi:hypothetical protein